MVDNLPEHKSSKIALFKGKQIRKAIDQYEWCFSIVDIVEVFTESSKARRYWSDWKVKLMRDEGLSPLYETIVPLKIESSDGKNYLTDTANTEPIFRII